jgi:hypothetical protein
MEAPITPRKRRSYRHGGLPGQLVSRAAPGDLRSRPEGQHVGQRTKEPGWQALHRLDAVRYADSNGYKRDTEKPFVWRYRDYVIQSLNHDKPFDHFVTEQIAGMSCRIARSKPSPPRAFSGSGTGMMSPQIPRRIAATNSMTS